MRFPLSLRNLTASAFIGLSLLSVPTAGHTEPAMSVNHTLLKADPKSPDKMIPVTHAMPGDELTGLVTYEYSGKEAGNNVNVTIPLKEEFKYVDGSATNEMQALFSTDNGKTYSPRPTLTKVETDGQERAAMGSDVTNIRWNIKKSLKKGDKDTLQYKIILK